MQFSEPTTTESHTSVLQSEAGGNTNVSRRRWVARFTAGIFTRHSTKSIAEHHAPIGKAARPSDISTTIISDASSQHGDKIFQRAASDDVIALTASSIQKSHQVKPSTDLSTNEASQFAGSGADLCISIQPHLQGEDDNSDFSYNGSNSFHTCRSNFSGSDSDNRTSIDESQQPVVRHAPITHERVSNQDMRDIIRYLQAQSSSKKQTKRPDSIRSQRSGSTTSHQSSARSSDSEKAAPLAIYDDMLDILCIHKARTRKLCWNWQAYYRILETLRRTIRQGKSLSITAADEGNVDASS